MSASTEKKRRQAAREAGTDKKTLAAREEAKKAAKSRRKWIIGTVLVVLLIVGILFLNSGFLYKHTTAVTIGDRSYSPAEVNYYYAEQYYNFYNQYGSYASLFGLDTSSGPFGLEKQDCYMVEDGTWKDYFLDSAYNAMAQVQALIKYANANGISLTEEEIASVDEDVAYLETVAAAYGYSSADNYLEANYGTGVTLKIARQAALDAQLASDAYSYYTDQLDYSDEELETYYASLEGSSDLFDYAYYYVAAETVAESEDADAAVTEQTMLEAKATAEAIMTSYKDDADTEDVYERLNAAVEAEFDNAAAVSRTGVAGSGLGDMSEWLLGSRKTGDIAVIEDSAGAGYYVVVFINRDDNHYPTVSVRHILVKAEADEDGTYSESALKAARSEAQRILAEYESGDKTEESFAALAEQYSDDAGSNTNGGLYENIYKGQTVEEFDAFCFDEHQKGDTAIVYGDNGSYAGYHVMYYVGEGELYSNYIARVDLTNEALTAWLDEITVEAVPHFWLKLVG